MKRRSVDLERVVAKAGQAESKVQQRFRRLLEKVERLRARVRAWKDGRADIDREIAAYAAAFHRQGKIVRELIRALDRAHSELSKADQVKVTRLIVEMTSAVLTESDDDDLKDIYNRHTRGDFDADRARADAETVEEMRAALEDHGVDLGDVEVSSLDELEELARAKLREQEPPPRKKSTKQVKAETRREEERKSADKAVQDVYRALARAIHPDRELDPAERDRKTRLMSEVNVAYEAKDLLKLLSLQLELEQVDAAQAGSMAEDRLRHYSRILDEQTKQLAAEIESAEAPFRGKLGRAHIEPMHVIVKIRYDRGAIEDQTVYLARDLETFSSVRLLKAWLRAQNQQRRYG
ncbi:MAG: hypothetical protein ABI175_06400 [Polyangiales bacterium]